MDPDDWNERYAARELMWTAEPNRSSWRRSPRSPSGRALDLACGEGRNAIWLAERGWQVTGVDFSEGALDKAARLATARGVEAEWVRADLVEYAPARSAYDLVLVFYLQVPAAQRRRSSAARRPQSRRMERCSSSRTRARAFGCVGASAWGLVYNCCTQAPALHSAAGEARR